MNSIFLIPQQILGIFNTHTMHAKLLRHFIFYVNLENTGYVAWKGEVDMKSYS